MQMLLSQLGKAGPSLTPPPPNDMCGFVPVAGAVDGVSKFWVRPRPGDPWRDSTQKEQEEYTALLAKTLPGGQAAQLPGLSGRPAGAGGVPGLSQLPGGINIQGPGQPQGAGHAAGQASPASSSMGPPMPGMSVLL